MIKYLLVSVANAYTTVIFIYVLMSWIPVRSGIVGDIYTVLGKLCDPFLDLFKRFIPPIGMVDISPIFAILVLELGVRIIVSLF